MTIVEIHLVESVFYHQSYNHMDYYGGHEVFRDKA